MAIAAIVAVLLGGVGAAIQIRIARLDPATAFFGNVPGGMAEMLTLGDRFGAGTGGDGAVADGSRRVSSS